MGLNIFLSAYEYKFHCDNDLLFQQAESKNFNVNQGQNRTVIEEEKSQKFNFVRHQTAVYLQKHFLKFQYSLLWNEVDEVYERIGENQIVL